LSRLYLIQLVPDGSYVRAVDLTTGRLVPDEPALIPGRAWSRLVSPDGRYMFTVYADGTSAALPVLHQLDLQEGKAWLIELPGSKSYNARGSYALTLSADGVRLYAAAGGVGAVVTVDVGAHRITHVAHVTPWTPDDRSSLPSATLSPDGKTLVFENAGYAWVFDVGSDRVLRTLELQANTVVAFGPSGKLWIASELGGLRAPPT